MLELAARLCGEEPTLDALNQAAASNPRIEAYRAAVEDWRRPNTEARASVDPKEVAYDRLRGLIELRDYRQAFSLADWGEQASEEDLRRAAVDLSAPQDPRRLRAYLGTFRRRAFPLDHPSRDCKLQGRYSGVTLGT